MAKSKVAVTIETDLLEIVDEMISRRQFPNRSQALEAALAEMLDRLGRNRLARECAKLEPDEERSMAEEGLSEIAEWPAY